MEALVIDRKTLPESINSLIGAERVRVERAEGRVILSPVIDPADYDNDTDYLSAIPGMVEKIIEGRNTPLSECVDFPEQKIGFMKGEFSVPADFDSMFKEEIEELFDGGCQ